MAKKSTNKGEDNLIPLNRRTKEEQRAIARQGGIASGKRRREQKTMREWAEQFMAMPMDMTAPDGSKVETTMGGAVVFQQIQRAITKKDTFSAKFLAKIIGEYENKVKVEGVVPQIIVDDKDTAEQLQKVLKGETDDEDNESI